MTWSDLFWIVFLLLCWGAVQKGVKNERVFGSK